MKTKKGKNIKQVEKEGKKIKQVEEEDKNRNASRKDSKLKWKKFQVALKHNPDPEVKDAWQVLTVNKNRKMQTKFIEAWAKDPEWNFVEVFKKSFMQKKDVQVVAKGWLTAKEMKSKYGSRAKEVMVKTKTSAWQYKVDDDDGELLFLRRQSSCARRARFRSSTVWWNGWAPLHSDISKLGHLDPSGDGHLPGLDAMNGCPSYCLTQP